jgi:hypothetical protein
MSNRTEHAAFTKVNAQGAGFSAQLQSIAESKVPPHLMQYVTRKQALGKLIDLGYPITESYWNKINLPSVGAGPAVDKWFGKRPLYFLPNVIAWAESRCSTTRGKLVA